MKKFLAVTLTLLLIAGLLAGCNKGTDTSGSEAESRESSASVSPKPPVVPQKELTPEEAAKENAKITDSDVHLIQFDEIKPGSEVAVIKTNAGEIRIILYREQAPKAVENFVTHAKEGYYNGMSFYKVLNNFTIQTGNPSNKEGESIYKDEKGTPVTFEDEFSLDLWNFRGALVMANKGLNRPNTNASEFFIVQAGGVSDEWVKAMEEINYPKSVIEKYKEIGGIPGFDWRNTVFGMVLGDSMDIVDKIATMDTDMAGRPATAVIIEDIKIEKM